MADINMTTDGAGNKLSGTTENGRHRLKKVIDIADVLAEKGSAIAQGDVIQVFDIPAQHTIVSANVHVTTAFDSTTVTLDVGTDLDVDQFVDGYDAKTAGSATPILTPEFIPAANTLDVLLVTMTGTLSAGKMTVVAIVDNMSQY